MQIAKASALLFGAIGLVGGLALTVAMQTHAQSASTTQAIFSQQKVKGQDESQGGHVGANGVKEQLLTGDTADKVKAAALAAVPDGTILRLETDAEGAVYEAHMVKTDGNRVTVKFDSNYNVTATESGSNGHFGRQ